MCLPLFMNIYWRWIVICGRHVIAVFGDARYSRSTHHMSIELRALLLNDNQSQKCRPNQFQLYCDVRMDISIGCFSICGALTQSAARKAFSGNSACFLRMRFYAWFSPFLVFLETMLSGKCKSRIEAAIYWHWFVLFIQKPEHDLVTCPYLAQIIR